MGGTTSEDAANNKPISLNGTYWYEHEIDGSVKNSIEFGNDGFSGSYIIPPKDITTTDSTKIPFTYEQNGNEIVFRIGSDIAMGKVSFNDQRQQVMITLVWADGHTEYFYNNENTANLSGSGDGSFGYGETNNGNL